MTAPPCPECAQGKCRNCDDTTWDDLVDGLAACPCAEGGHGAPPVKEEGRHEPSVP